MRPGSDLPPPEVQAAAGFIAYKLGKGASIEEALAYAEFRLGVSLPPGLALPAIRAANQARDIAEWMKLLPPDTPMSEIYRRMGISAPEVGVRVLVEGKDLQGRAVRTGSAVVDVTPEMTIGEIEEVAESGVVGLYDSGGVERWETTPLPSLPFPQQSRQ